MDLTFAQAMQSIEAFHPQWKVALFDGPALRGVLCLSAPEVCIHGNPIEMTRPLVDVSHNGAAVASYDCGCVYLGRFEERNSA